MNLNSQLNYSLNKNKSYKKDMINKNVSKIINLILSNKSHILSNLKFQSNIINIKKGFSLKNYNYIKNKNSKTKENQRLFYRGLSKLNLINKTNINIINIYNKKKNKIKYNNFYTLKKPNHYNNLKNNEIPNDVKSFQKTKKKLLNYLKTEFTPKLKKSKIFSISRNLDKGENSLIIKRKLKRDLSSFEKIKNENRLKRTIKSLNKNINKFYLIKKQKNFSQSVRTKINLYMKKQKKFSQGEYSSVFLKKNEIQKKDNILNSYGRFKKKRRANEQNNTFFNITTNNSDKNTTTYSNNIHYTNYNSITNISDANNEFNYENKCSKEKKTLKKKINLPFHPNSKKDNFYIKIDSKNYLLRNNKSEINIPLNKKNKILKIKRDKMNNIYKLIKMKNKKFRKYGFNNTTRMKNNSMFLCRNKNFISSFDCSNSNTKKNNFCICSSCKKDNKEFCEDIEMNHFRIVTIIQENKKILSENEKKK